MYLFGFKNLPINLIGMLLIFLLVIQNNNVLLLVNKTAFIKSHYSYGY